MGFQTVLWHATTTIAAATTAIAMSEPVEARNMPIMRTRCWLYWLDWLWLRLKLTRRLARCSYAMWPRANQTVVRPRLLSLLLRYLVARIMRQNWNENDKCATDTTSESSTHSLCLYRCLFLCLCPCLSLHLSLQLRLQLHLILSLRLGAVAQAFLTVF